MSGMINVTLQIKLNVLDNIGPIIEVITNNELYKTADVKSIDITYIEGEGCDESK